MSQPAFSCAALTIVADICDLMNYHQMRYFFVFLATLIILCKSVSSQPNTNDFPQDSVPPHRYFGVQLIAAAVSKPEFSVTAGNYRLQSKLQALFGAGFNYYVSLDQSFSMIYGLEVHLLSTNYFLLIPDSDLPGFLSTNGAPQIQDKEVYFKVAFPLLLSYRLGKTTKGGYSLTAGLKVNYSGFSPDLITTTQIADASLQRETIFRGEFKSSNDKKPWVTFVAGVSKNVYLGKKSELSVALLLELSRTNFIEGSYTISVPNQPVTNGSYAVKASSVGIGLQYKLPRFKRKEKHS